MPHYVNVAWGNFFLACLFVGGLGQLFGFGFLPLKISTKRKNGNYYYHDDDVLLKREITPCRVFRPARGFVGLSSF